MAQGGAEADYLAAMKDLGLQQAVDMLEAGVHDLPAAGPGRQDFHPTFLSAMWFGQEPLPPQVGSSVTCPPRVRWHGRWKGSRGKGLVGPLTPNHFPATFRAGEGKRVLRGREHPRSPATGPPQWLSSIWSHPISSPHRVAAPPVGSSVR